VISQSALTSTIVFILKHLPAPLAPCVVRDCASHPPILHPATHRTTYFCRTTFHASADTAVEHRELLGAYRACKHGVMGFIAHLLPHHPIQRASHVAVDVAFDFPILPQRGDVVVDSGRMIAVVHQPSDILPRDTPVVLQNLQQFGLHCGCFHISFVFDHNFTHTPFRIFFTSVLSRNAIPISRFDSP